MGEKQFRKMQLFRDVVERVRSKKAAIKKMVSWAQKCPLLKMFLTNWSKQDRKKTERTRSTG